MSNGQAFVQDDVIDAFEDSDSAMTSTTENGVSRGWSSDHGINIRLTIPFFVTKYYVTIVAGTERRTPKRRAEERKKHPLWKLRNIAFLAMAVVYVWFYVEMVSELVVAFGNRY